MPKETKYGVISDVHQDPKMVPVAVDLFKKLGVNKILVNGDIFSRQNSLKETQDYSAFILDSIGKGGLESFIQPGSHESLLGYGPVIDFFAEKYDNIFDTQRISHVDQDSHHLIFLPGSDYLNGGEYHLGNENVPSGRYLKTEKGLMKFTELNHYAEAIERGISRSAIQYTNMNDIKELVTEPDKTIIVCHVPRRFDNLETCVDVAHFWQGRVYHRNPENMQDYTFTELSVIPGSVSKNIVEESNSTKAYSIGELSEEEIKSEAIKIINKENVERWQVFVERKENRGNNDLKNLYEELGIKKALSGHFHESGHRANNRKGEHVNPGEFVDELFWNSGCLDMGQTGILTVNEDKVSYRNIKINIRY